MTLVQNSDTWRLWGGIMIESDEMPQNHMNISHDLEFLLQNQDGTFPGNSDTSQFQEGTMIDSDEMRLGHTHIAQDLTCSLQNRERASSELRDERQRLLVSNACKDSEINQLREWKEGAERELQELRAEYAHQAHTLRHYQLRNLRVVKEYDIKNQYDDLCWGVVDWVMGEMFHFEHRFGYEQGPITDGGNPYMRDVLDLIPVVGEHLIGALIHRHIQQRFFGENLILFGLPEPITSLLHETGLSMEKLEPQKDIADIKTWRSDTLKAIASIPSVAITRTLELETFTNDLFFALSRIFPGLHAEPTSKPLLYEEVSTCAAELEENIHLSSDAYLFGPFQDPFQCCYEAVTTEILSRVICVDAETRITLKPDSPVIADSCGYIGRPLFQLEPGLWNKIDCFDNNFRILRREKWLLKLFAPLPRLSGTLKTIEDPQDYSAMKGL